MAFVPKTGIALLQDPRYNKGTAFTEAERDALGIRGLLPPRVFTMDEQLARVMENFRAQDSALERYVFMVALQDRNETLFYRTVLEHLTEMLPVIYTPTVGEACQRFGHIYRRPRGLYVLYTGLARERVHGAEYAELVEEFVVAVQAAFPGALIQFEDFAAPNAFALLERYRDRVCTFNDDMQGTGAVTLAALLASERLSGRSLAEERILFLGAGSAACGIAGVLAAALRGRGVPDPHSRERIWMYDRHGLLTSDRRDLSGFARAYARGAAPVRSLEEAVATLKPTVLIGVSGQPGLFAEPVLRALASVTHRPLVLALSNPTSRAECTAEEAYRWTGGGAVYASGSPFDPVALDGRRLEPSQANNAYIFPGVGLGVSASGATRVTDRMFLAAAEALAALASAERLESGALFPPLSAIRDVSVAVAAAVVRIAEEQGLATRQLPPEPAGRDAHLRAIMYQPRYRSYLPESL